jgi:hypothetical protein
LVLASLLLVGLQCALVGVWAGFAPESFVADFPGLGLRWVVTSGYDEHFVRDVGFLHLPLAAIAGRLLWQEWSSYLTEGRVFGAAWSAFAIPHLVFHVTHTDGISGIDLVSSLVALALAVVAGAVLVVSTPGRRPHQRHDLTRAVRS